MIRLICLCIGLLPIIHCISEHQFQDGEVQETIDVPVQYSVHRRSVERQKRDLGSENIANDHEMFFYAFGKNFSLYFEQYDHVLMGSDTPIIAAYTDKEKDSGVKYKKIPDVLSKLRMKPLHDVKNNAIALEYYDDDGTERLMGLIDDSDMRLKWTLNSPVGYIEHVQPTLRVSRLWFDQSRFPNMSGWRTTSPNPIENKPTRPPRRPYFPTIRPKPVHAPETVYPEVLVLVDYKSYLAHNKSPVEIAKYMFEFWTAVDLRYRSLKHPKVRLNIAGIIIAMDRGALPYTNLELTELLSHMAIRLHHEKKNLPRYDAAMLVLHKPMFSITSSKFVGGAAIHKGACSITGVGTGLDGGNFSGIGTIAHELAHLLGADDEIKDAGDTPKKCLDDNRVYIMGYADDKDDENKVRMHFSECSLKLMHKFLNSEHAKCLYNKPSVGKPLSKVLPRLSLADQCEKEYGPGWTNANRGQPACELLVCCKWIYCKSVGNAAAEGAVCAPGKICLNGNCVEQPKGLNDWEVDHKEPIARRNNKKPKYPSRKPNRFDNNHPWWTEVFDFDFS